MLKLGKEVLFFKKMSGMLSNKIRLTLMAGSSECLHKKFMRFSGEF